MAKRYVLCVLSLMRDNALPFRYTFDGGAVGEGLGNGEGRYEGVQTNVAPVEALIDLANRKHSQNTDEPQVTKVIFLCSEECRSTVVRGVPGTESGGLTTEAYFKGEIRKYLGRRVGSGEGASTADDYFVRLNYKTSDPASNLQAVIDAIGDGDVIVDVDTTGGGRDAVNLVTLAIEVLQSQGEIVGGDGHPRLGTTVYARALSFPNRATGALGVGDISIQDDAYALNDLVAAVRAFVSFGKAGMIRSHFAAATRTSPEMDRLCEDLGEFSDRLSICDVARLPALVSAIHDDLDSLTSCVRRRCSSNRAARACLDRMDDLSWPSGRRGAKFGRQRADVLGMREGVSIADRNVREVLQSSGFSDDDVSAIMRTRNLEGLRSTLEVIALRSVVGSDELLFAALVPSIRNGFVGGSRGRSMTGGRVVIETIRWCVRREMLQQALTLFKEQAPTCMSDLGYISWVDEPKCTADETSRARVDRMVWLSNRGSPLPHNDAIPRDKHVAITERGRAVMPAITYWYATLNTIRNDVMHLREGDSSRSRDNLARQLLQYYRGTRQAMDRIGCSYDDLGTLESLASDIEMGLLALEGEIPLTAREGT